MEFPIRSLDEEESDPGDPRDLCVPAPPQHPISTARQRQHHRCYLGVKKQRGGSQVLLLEGTHGVCHLPLLHPAGQQHRGLHTSQAAPPCLNYTQGCSPTHTNVFLPLLLDATNSDAQLPRRKCWKQHEHESPPLGSVFD